MKLNIIHRIDLNCLDYAIALHKGFDYLSMNSNTKIEICCNSNGLAVNYQVGKDKSYCRYKGIKIVVDESMQDGEVKFLKNLD